jgi:hypothetical protein
LVKRKRKRKRPTGLSAPLTPEEKRQLDSILEGFPDLDPLEVSQGIAYPNLACAVIEGLPADKPETVPILLALKERFEQKDVRKAVKRAVFKLRRKGISVEEIEADKDSSILVRSANDFDSEARVSPVDGNGNRGVFVAFTQIPRGMGVGMGAANDREGILQFIYGTYSRKKMKEIRSLFLDNFGDAVETSIPHVSMILEEAYNESGETLNEYSEGYLGLRPWLLDHAPPREKPVIFDVISPEEISEEILTPSQIEKLLNHKLMESWGMEPEETESLVNEIQEAKDSPILLNDIQRQERVDEIKMKALSDVYSEERRRLEKRRLEEMAYVFYMRDEMEYSRISLAAALSLDRKESVLQVNPYLSALLNRSIDYLRMSKEDGGPTSEEGDGQSGLIIT